jgi:GGDEF domain-containing protein
VARLGGDEFAVLQGGGGSAEDARVLAERLLAVIA